MREIPRDLETHEHGRTGTGDEIEFHETLDGLIDRAFHSIEIRPATP